jgi:hypothetical protein
VLGYRQTCDACLAADAVGARARCSDLRPTSTIPGGGLVVEGGVLYDFTRWFGVYVKGLLGYGGGRSDTGAPVQLGFIGVGSGLQFRITE